MRGAKKKSDIPYVSECDRSMDVVCVCNLLLFVWLAAVVKFGFLAFWTIHSSAHFSVFFASCGARLLSLLPGH